MDLWTTKIRSPIRWSDFCLPRTGFLPLVIFCPFEQKALILLGFPAVFLAFPRWFEHPTYRLGGLTYPLEGVCNIHFLHKIRIFRDFMVKNELFSITSADFTASPERVVPRRVPKMAPFIQNRIKLLFRRRGARVFFCFYDRNIGEVFFGRSAPAEILVAAVHWAGTTATSHKLVCTRRFDFVAATIAANSVLDDYHR